MGVGGILTESLLGRDVSREDRCSCVGWDRMKGCLDFFYILGWRILHIIYTIYNMCPYFVWFYYHNVPADVLFTLCQVS